MAREMARAKDSKGRSPRGRAARSDAPKPTWSSAHAPFSGLPPAVADPLRAELAASLRRLADREGFDFGAAFSSDPTNRRAGVRPPDLAYEGLVPSRAFEPDAVRDVVVQVVR